MNMSELITWLRTRLTTPSFDGEFHRGYRLALAEVLSKVDTISTLAPQPQPGAVIAAAGTAHQVFGEKGAEKL